MAHNVNKQGKLIFKVLNQQEQINVENWLLGRKVKFRIKGKTINQKKGSKSGKTYFNISDEQQATLNSLKILTLKDFCIKYNKELKWICYDTLYSKTIRNKRVLDYLLTKQIIQYKVKYRTRLGITNPIVYFEIKQENCDFLLEFYRVYLSSLDLDNYKDLKIELKRRNKTELLEILENKKNKKHKKERTRYQYRKVKKVGMYNKTKE